MQKWYTFNKILTIAKDLDYLVLPRVSLAILSLNAGWTMRSLCPSLENSFVFVVQISFINVGKNQLAFFFFKVFSE